MRLMKPAAAPPSSAPSKTAPLERVRVLFADQLNLARGKYIPKTLAGRGWARFCVGAFAVTYSKQLIAAPGGGADVGLPDIEAVFDPSDLRPSWEANTTIALCDLMSSGSPSPLCGRSALKRAIGQWRDLGYEPMIGLEGEAYVFQRSETGGWEPYDTPGAFVYGTGPFADPQGLMEEVWSTAIRCGLPVDSINAEYDSPQFELALTYDDALKACDDFFLFRQMAREVLFRRGYLLSFLPKPIAELSGTGLHINMSFKDRQGRNAFDGGTERGALSDLAAGCTAGLLRHHEALGAILAPIVNSYDRLAPASLSGYWANWGHDHRGVAVRISGENGAGARIEHRVGDCAASPYFAVAAALHAARLGFIEKYDLPPAETGDGLETVNATRHTAHSLAESLAALEADPVLVDAIGRPMIENYAAIKRSEIAELAGKSRQEIFDYYAPFI